MARYNQQLGHWGEQLAANYLIERGYILVAENARTPYGEIDLIVLKEDLLRFVEVKTRSNKRFGEVESAVNAKKLRHMTESGMHWIQENSALPKDIYFQLDVIAIYGTPKKVIEIIHIENVYE